MPRTIISHNKQQHFPCSRKVNVTWMLEKASVFLKQSESRGRNRPRRMNVHYLTIRLLSQVCYERIVDDVQKNADA